MPARSPLADRRSAEPVLDPRLQQPAPRDAVGDLRPAATEHDDPGLTPAPAAVVVPERRLPPGEVAVVVGAPRCRVRRCAASGEEEPDPEADREHCDDEAPGRHDEKRSQSPERLEGDDEALRSRRCAKPGSSALLAGRQGRCTNPPIGANSRESRFVVRNAPGRNRTSARGLGNRASSCTTRLSMPLARSPKSS